MQTITRKGSFDAMHRVMDERFKCFNIHGHTYICELTFWFNDIKQIGYAMDFKDIKALGFAWIDKTMDHGAILNPLDTAMLNACQATGSKVWVMSLNGEGYCNPTVENISREIFLAMRILFLRSPIHIFNVRLWETPNCYTDCNSGSISKEEIEFFKLNKQDEVEAFRDAFLNDLPA